MKTYGSDFSKRRKKIAPQIVSALIENMSNRYGFDQLWESMSEADQVTLRAQWVSIVESFL